jgi:UDP-4-amino-4,6-dideoxy-N-acetyl-beta-L-altrosamine transaminase
MSHPIPYGKQTITQDDIQAVVDAMQSEFLTQGPRINEFEQAFAHYVGSKYAVAVANGTAALHLCTLALGVKSGDRVICTPITFVASSNCVLYCGGKVEFADIDPDTALLDVKKVKALLEASPKGTYQGIIPVDFGGFPVDLEAFRKLADDYGLWIIEDACHAPGGYFTDSRGVKQKCGNGKFADLSIFSFHPVKHIATGEGGMITTNDEKLYSKLLKLRTHGITRNASELGKNDGGWYYEMQELGFNYRIPDVLCALGTSQLKRADEGLLKRQAIAKIYDEAFRDNAFVQPVVQFAKLEKQGISHAYHLYIIKTRERLKLYNFLKERNIHPQVHYIPVHQMPYYRNHVNANAKFKEAESYYASCLSLPMYPSLSESDQRFVIESIIDFVRNQS